MRATLIVVLLVANARADEAQPVPPSPAPPDGSTTAAPADPFDAPTGTNAAARELFLEARKLSKAGQQAEACSSYADSWAREETVTTMFYLGTCRETDGKNAEAWRLYQEVATRSDRDGSPERAKIARDRAAALDAKLGTLVIHFAKPIMAGTVVNLDGRPIDMAPELRERVDPGEVLVTAKGPTGVTSSKLIKVPARNVVYVEVPSLRDQGTYRRRTWMVASGVLLLGGVIAIGTRNGYAALAGAGAIVGGVTVFLLAPRDRVTVVPMTIGSSGGGVALTGSF